MLAMSIELSACKIALEASMGLIVGVAVAAAAPEEIAASTVFEGVTAAAAAAGIKVGGKELSEWIWEGVKSGAHSADSLAEYVCKKAGAS